MKPLALVPVLLALAAAALPGQARGGAFKEVDFARVERRLRREPTYVGEPLYALLLFGPRAEARVWAVLDRSKADLAYHDVLYFDLDADGDLTERGERFTGTYRERGARAGMALVIRIGDYRVPGTDLVHKNLRFSTVRKPGRQGIWLGMDWRGKVPVSGGLGPAGMDCTRWATSPATAPILRPTARGPLSFAFWGPERVVLTSGRATAVSFIVGNRGSRADTLCALDENLLVPGQDVIVATLLARRRDGRELRVRNEITGHC